jgi:hypothetical protein
MSAGSMFREFKTVLDGIPGAFASSVAAWALVEGKSTATESPEYLAIEPAFAHASFTVAVVPIVDGPFSLAGNSVRIVPAPRIWGLRGSNWNASSISVVFLAMSVVPTTNANLAEAYVTH